MSEITPPLEALAAEEMTTSSFDEPPSLTIKDQRVVEQAVKRIYSLRAVKDGERWQDKSATHLPLPLPQAQVFFFKRLTLYRQKHALYLSGGLHSLSASFESLDPSRPWLVYWILHGLELLEALPSDDILANVVSFLGGYCQLPSGGFGGGPNQHAHLAPTYATACALAIVGTPAAINIVDRKSLYRFLMDVKFPNGSFAMERGGEVDVRAAYCALVVSTLFGVRTTELEEGVADWIASCQTYEGGFGAEPGCEAHGGYTFCAFAALRLLGATDRINLKALRRWTSSRQLGEGGFNGRTNKLVDGCYSFWVGALGPLMDAEEEWVTSPLELQKYLLACCQDERGGLLDKPGKGRDFYHTCYTLSGLSLAQRAQGSAVLGHEENLLAATDPVFNIGPDKVERAISYFAVAPPFR